MNYRLLVPVSALAAAMTVLPLTGQAPSSTQSTAKAWTHPKTPWGDPDLQGVWPSTELIGTPLQRPETFGDRALLSDEEFAQRETNSKKQAQTDNEEFAPANRNVGVGPPAYWTDRGRPNRQASLVVDPPNGRIPPITEEARKLAATRADARKGRGAADSYEDRSLWDRCITRGPVGSIVTGPYNQGNEIHQAPGYVVLRTEMIHESRIIPLDGRARVGAGIRNLMGDSRGHWEGNTLVVETANFAGNVPIGGAPTSDALRLVERITRTGAGTLQYEITVEDSKTWTKPWKIAFPLKQDSEYQLYEYACHEGNYALKDILSGARADERAAK